jgi:hypothetical protein
LSSLYRPGQRGWIKINNPAYWLRDQEIASLRRPLERRSVVALARSAVPERGA